MVAFLVLLTFCVFIVIDLIRQKKTGTNGHQPGLRHKTKNTAESIQPESVFK